MNESPLSQNQG